MDSSAGEVTNVCSHQPSFLPYVGFWNKLMQCDTEIVLAGVDFNWRDYQHRVKICGSWLTLAVDSTTKHGPIKSVKLVEGTLKSAATRIEAQLCVKKFKYADRIGSLLKYLKEHSEYPRMGLLEVNMGTQYLVQECLGIKTHVSPYLTPPNKEEDKHQRLLTSLRSVRNPVYWAGPGAIDGYIDKNRLPFKFMAQTLKEGIFKESILQILVQEPDPIDYIANVATWKELT